MERPNKVWRHKRDNGGVLLGLCAGIGAHLGVDPIIVRLGLIIAMLAMPAGLTIILVYFLFALFIPYEPQS